MKRILIISSFILSCPATTFAQKQWTLTECIDYAIEHSINIQRQQDAVKQQELSLSTAKNSRLPDLSASAGENFGFGRALTSNNTYENNSTTSTSFSLGTSVPLITGGRIPAEIAKSKINLQAALVDLDKAKQDISLNVASAYLEAICAKELVDVARKQVELTKAQKHRIEELVKNGKLAETQLAEINATLANDELSLTQQTNNSTIALLTLSQLLELPTPEGFDIANVDVDGIETASLANPDATYSEAVVAKPQILAQELRIKSAERDIDISKSGLYPSLYFSAGLGSNYYNTSGYQVKSFSKQIKDNFNQYIGLSLSVPIFNRFSTRNNIRSARLQLHSQQLTLDETKKALYKEIQQAYYNALAAQKQCASSATALKASETAFNLMEKKFENGKATSIEYQESKTSLAKAQSNNIQAIYTFIFRNKILNFYRGITL